MSIAFAIAEALLNTQAFTLFVTHYPQITSLPSMYPNVKNVHLKTSIDTRGVGQTAAAVGAEGGIVYLHEIGSGPCDMRSGYGLIMAEQCGYPADIVADAREIRRAVRDAYPILSAHQSPAEAQDNQPLVALNGLLKHLLLLQDSTLDEAGLRHYLHSLRGRYTDEMVAVMRSYLDAAHTDSNQAAAAVSAAAVTSVVGVAGGV